MLALILGLVSFVSAVLLWFVGRSPLQGTDPWKTGLFLFAALCACASIVCGLMVRKHSHGRHALLWHLGASNWGVGMALLAGVLLAAFLQRPMVVY